VDRVAREELIHAAQRRYPVDILPMLAHPFWPILKRAVAAREYTGLSDQTVVHEVTAQLAAGHAATMKIGSSDAIAFLKRYFEALTENYGAEGAREVLQYAEPAIRKALGYRPERNSRGPGPESREHGGPQRSRGSAAQPGEPGTGPL
jgi:hypothetical protein